MDHMKSDMAGAAAVLGAALIAARLALPLRLTVVVPAAENMPDGGAVKPADVITMADGQTVEVLNTDAEGRLILADALWYAGRQKPDYIIDAATLTRRLCRGPGQPFRGRDGQQRRGDRRAPSGRRRNVRTGLASAVDRRAQEDHGG